MGICENLPTAVNDEAEPRPRKCSGGIDCEKFQKNAGRRDLLMDPGRRVSVRSVSILTTAGPTRFCRCNKARLNEPLQLSFGQRLLAVQKQDLMLALLRW